MDHQTPLGEIQSKALETAQRLIDYRSYGQNETKALAALRRRIDGWDKDDCREWLNKAIEVHHAAVAFVDEHQSEAFGIYGRNEKEWDFSSSSAPFFSRFPEFQRERLMQHLEFVFYIHHLR